MIDVRTQALWVIESSTSRVSCCIKPQLEKMPDQIDPFKGTEVD